MTRFIRHSDGLRENDGAIEWRNFFTIFKRDNEGMFESLGDRKQQEKIPVLLGMRRKYVVLAGHPRPVWRKQS